MEEAVDKGRATGVPLGQSLIDAGIVDSNQLAQALAERNGLDYVDLNAFEVDQGAANLIDAGKARRYQTIPISFLGEQTLLVATADPANVLALDDIAMATGYEVRRAVASPEDIDALIGQLSRLGDAVEELEDDPESAAEVIELRDQADEAPVVKLVHSVIADAVRRGASDIHFEPRASDMRVRYRVDGVVMDTTTVPRQLVAGLISRVKIMANLDIAERRIPQDGRIGLSVDGRHVDLRVATLPVVRGESIVMRILDKEAVVMDLDVLGMADHDRKRFNDALHATHGAILVTGPTGSGKTTTLYAGPDHRQHAGEDDHHGRGPGRVRADRRQAGAGQPEDRPHVRRRAALDGPRRPRRDHGRRGARPGHRADRDRVGADRPPRAHDAPHQRRAAGGRAAGRDGHRAVPGRLRRRVRRRAAAGAPPVRLQGLGGAVQGAARRPGLRGATRASPASSRSAACAATTPATAAGWASTRSCRSPTGCAS